MFLILFAFDDSDVQKLYNLDDQADEDILTNDLKPSCIRSPIFKFSNIHSQQQF